MELLQDFGHFRYPNAIGPGVYDIHSTRPGCRLRPKSSSYWKRRCK